ncbi:MAG: hypothetical protein AUJ57_07070 [Zetaproteobacteria bacterium CG1_02_53_45]|nr:MAG: hypothetical protein AUJ57_07070 [Zetaproteobacteria bacterium CG1_02_53_45]
MSRPWDLSIRTSVGHNDNVQLVPNITTFPVGGSKSANYFSLQVDGKYRFYQSNQWEAGVTLAATSLWYENKLQTITPPQWKFNDYNFGNYNPGVYTTYLFQAADMPASITASYDFYNENGHNNNLGALGLSSHNFHLSGSIRPLDNLQLTLSLLRGVDNFQVTFPDPALDDRDGVRTGIDLGARMWLDHGRHNVSVGLGYLDNKAKGSNFDYKGYNSKARFETGLLNPVWLAAEIDYANYKYNGFAAVQPWKLAFITPPGRTSQKITTTLVQAIWPVTPHWFVDAFYRHESYKSNMAQFAASVNIYGTGLSYRF